MTRKKQHLYNKVRKHRSPRSWEQFWSYRNSCTTALRRARENYNVDIISEGLINIDCRPFWRYAKSQKQENCSVASLKEKGKLYSDSTSIAEILNQKYTSVFTSDAEDTQANMAQVYLQCRTLHFKWKVLQSY